MLINLLSQNNYGQFNITLAKTIGLHESIYLSALMDINDKAVRKNCLDGNMFIVDREYIEKRTTLKEPEQLKIDASLKSIGVLKTSETDVNKVEIDITMLVSIMSSENETVLKDVEETVKGNLKASKSNKVDYLTTKAKEAVITRNMELRAAYFRWIDAVVAKTGWMSAGTVESTQETIDKYTNRNLDVALAILKISTDNAYRDVVWAIKSYEQYSKLNTSSSMNVVQGYTDVSGVSEVSF